VGQGVVDYTVGGRLVFKSWFDYRKKDPGGRRPSPLDRIIPTTWDPDWTAEAIDLLTVLSPLTDLQSAQADLLDRVISSPLISMKDLQASGTRWPEGQQDRKPRYSPGSLRRFAPPPGQGTLI
jgi:hypothetical protein